MTFRNLILPFFVLIIVLVLWVSQNLFKEQRVELPLPLRLTNLPEDRVVTHIDPDDLVLFVEGKGIEILRFSRSEYYLNIDASKLQVGNNELNVTEQDIFLSDSQFYLQMSFFLSTQIMVKVETTSIKQIPVTIRYMTIDDENFFRLRNVKVQPQRVEIVGPSSIVGKLTEVTTEPLSMEDVRETDRIKADLEIPEGILGIKPDLVTINLESPEIITRTIPLIRIDYPAGRISMIIPNSVTIKVEGLAERVQNLRPQTISAYIAVPDEFEYDYAPILFRLPEGVKIIEYTPQRVQIFRDQED
jgi:hypothetical protein